MRWPPPISAPDEIAAPADIAEAILFVAAHRFATDSTVRVDGGDAPL